ncbi:MAG: WecB/TagA/CpsF family glycosyltransferase [Sedimentisphaerales bacterium]|nr:WecB/TagA/CpsF family glycosyltransferase [Sedimentisphaerales bacterium]
MWRCQILGIPIDLIDHKEVLQHINRWRAQGLRQFIVLATAADIHLSQEDGLRMALHSSGLNLPDGIAIVMAARILGFMPKGRVAGPDLMWKLCDWGRDYGYRHFFYGSTPDIVSRLIANLTRRFPGIEIAGYLCPPFRQPTPQEDVEMIRQINACRSDIVWVGLGGIRQIRWMADHLDKVIAPAMIGVGAAFNFHSGLVKRAPRWMRQIGMEWSFRMITEPRKIVPRTRHTLMFCIRVTAQALKTSWRS